MGAAYVFMRTGTAWSEIAKLTPTNGAATDYFGEKVSISNDYIVVGSLMDDDRGDSSGSAYVYKRDGTTWNFLAKLNASDGLPGDNFTQGIGLSENFIAVGANNGDHQGVSQGTAYFYKIQNLPTIVEIENQTIDIQQDSCLVNLNIVDTDGRNITITAQTANEQIVPYTGIHVNGTGTYYSVIPM
ncbi:MAG: hypothetical protein OMM_03942 [Candidatus Magnetoglobus multicellularis str. Araruama]|uniref:PKD domain-containing protein n=1 Tax=Candidatus Magnetoglobus multicellularis str. Araruama TaxID=890399 RepID=A0A1V1P3P2_9BACT|nr:MAG: hypothetical protein OMM_03942 [Candidatus Magnetoglobus multicellularis str. Araruama]